VAQKAVGIDIGGTGIKGAIVDVESGELLTDRLKKPTPAGGEPDDIVAVVKQIVEELGVDDLDVPVGVCFPAAIMDGKTLSASRPSASSRPRSGATSTSSTTPTRRATPRRATARRRASRGWSS
jgi:predicted NBD/HSP70 family sugar kinase